MGRKKVYDTQMPDQELFREANKYMKESVDAQSVIAEVIRAYKQGRISREEYKQASMNWMLGLEDRDSRASELTRIFYARIKLAEKNKKELLQKLSGKQSGDGEEFQSQTIKNKGAIYENSR